MDLTSVIAPYVAKPQAPVTPTVQQMALSPAMTAAQQTTTVTRTQTIQAPQATGKAEAPREARSATHTAQSVDSGTGAVQAHTNGGRPPPRGSLLDVSV